MKEESANPPLHSSAVRHYVSPRDFLGLIRAFVSLVNEKRAELEDQQVPCLKDSIMDYPSDETTAAATFGWMRVSFVNRVCCRERFETWLVLHCGLDCTLVEPVSR